jgi:uncharacterized protein (TIRG00374 family)
MTTAAELDMAALTAPGSRRRPPATSIVLVLGIALLAGEVYLGRHELGHALIALETAEPGWVAVEIAFTLISMQCFARAQRYMLRAVAPRTSLPQLSVVRMVRLTYSANALSTTMPAGGPISIVYILRQVRSWGLSYAAAGFALVASGLLSSATFAALVAACGLASGRRAAAVAVAATVLLTTLLTYGARRIFGLHLTTAVAALVGRLGRRLARLSTTAAEALESASAELEAIRPRRRDWAGATTFAAGNWLADLASLVAVSRAVPGAGHAGLVALLAAYLAGMSASSIAVLPGGFGVVELAMIVTLHASGMPVATATAVVLLYRLVSCVLVVLLGWAALGWMTLAGRGITELRRGHRRADRRVDERELNVDLADRLQHHGTQDLSTAAHVAEELLQLGEVDQ